MTTSIACRWLRVVRTLQMVPILCLLIHAAGCSTDKPAEVPKIFDTPIPVGQPALVPADPKEIPNFAELYSHDSAILDAIDQSLAYFAKKSSQKYFPYNTSNSVVTHDVQVATLKKLREIYTVSTSANEFGGRMREAFDVYKSVGRDWKAKSGEVLFTGYYTPIFDGSLTPDSRFRYPLYKRPADLVTDDEGVPRGRKAPDGTTVPYYTRSEIEKGQLLKGTELVWLADKFEVYIIHVQGSARIRLPDGREMHVGYHGKTDRPYESVGQKLIKDGKIQSSELSLARLKRYFKEHPEETDAALAVNPSYVFFQESQPGPFGSIGAKVTPVHTVATDKSIFPRGGPVVAQTTIPSGAGADMAKGAPHLGMYLDQDTGGAIRAAGRADLYMGVGPEAEKVAGYTHHEGKLFYLFIKAPKP